MQLSFAKLTALFLGPLLLFAAIADAKNQRTAEADRKAQMGASMRDINDVMEAHAAKLMALPGVVGVFVGALDNGTPCIKVMVVKTSPELEKKIPKDLEGHPVLILETGEIKPRSERPLPRNNHQPTCRYPCIRSLASGDKARTLESIRLRAPAPTTVARRVSPRCPREFFVCSDPRSAAPRTTAALYP